MGDDVKALRIGFIGTGTIGQPIVRNLLRNGWPVTVWNRTPARYADLVAAGASAAATPRELAASTDVVIAMLMAPEHLDGLLDGPDGILAGVHSGSIFIDMATSPPRRAMAGRALCGERLPGARHTRARRCQGSRRGRAHRSGRRKIISGDFTPGRPLWMYEKDRTNLAGTNAETGLELGRLVHENVRVRVVNLSQILEPVEHRFGQDHRRGNQQPLCVDEPDVLRED